MPGYRITPRAKEDLLKISRYTERRWGKSQRNIYLKHLGRRFEWLSANSSLGKQRNDIHRGLYSFPQGRHVIFYLIHSKGIDIIGVLHKEVDVLNYFNSTT